MTDKATTRLGLRLGDGSACDGIHPLTDTGTNTDPWLAAMR